MCYFNRLTRVARCLAGYPEWLQFCWGFVKPPRNDEIALQHFFLPCLRLCKNFFSISFVSKGTKDYTMHLPVFEFAPSRSIVLSSPLHYNDEHSFYFFTFYDWSISSYV